MTEPFVAVVTGANRGLGLATARALAKCRFKVVMVGRDAAKTESAAGHLRREGLDAESFVADVRDAGQVRDLRDHLAAQYGHVEALVNNAGVIFEPLDFSRPQDASVLDIDPDLVARTFDTNTLGPMRLCQALVPAMLAKNYGRIVNIASGMGQLADMNGYWPGYRISKTALNALTRILADETKGSNVKINSVDPGWVRTDMGGPHATRSPEEAMSGIVWAATLPDDGPSGGFFRDGEAIPW